MRHAERSHTFWLLIGGLALVILAALGSVQLLYNQPLRKASVTSYAHAPQQMVAGKYLFTGTSYWARAIETEAHGDYAQPFSKLNTLHREAYDAWQTDLECPITSNTVSYQVQVQLLKFNCRPEFLPDAAKYFNLINLANNHTDNENGIVGLTETRERLSKVPGLQYFGNFDPGVANDVCEVVALPVRLEQGAKKPTQAHLPVAFCAWHYVFRLPLPGEIAVMKKFAQIMPVFAFAHMGREYIPKADAVQESIAHTIIDQGPEFLIANQSHWVQNTEVYKGKLIVFSTGNFIFDQLDAETNRGDNIAVTISLPVDANVRKWLALGPHCEVYHDDCFAAAEQEGLKKVSLTLSYGVVASQGGYRELTHLADAATQAAVEQRMGWAAVCRLLRPPYSCTE